MQEPCGYLRRIPALCQGDARCPTYDQRPFTVMMAFRRTAQADGRGADRRLEADGYGGVQPAYHALFENIDPEGTRLTELAARADMTHQSMGELVAVLERARMGRAPARPDRRPRAARLPHSRGHARSRRRGLHHINEIEAEWQERWRGGRLRRNAAPRARAGAGRRRARLTLTPRARRPASAPRPPTARRGGRGSACRSDGARATTPSRPAPAGRRRRPSRARRRSPTVPSQPAATRSATRWTVARSPSRRARPSTTSSTRPGPAVQEEVARRAGGGERAPVAPARQQVDDLAARPR